MSAKVPQFSIVSAIYNVAAYLPQFLESIDSQTLPAEQLQVVLVDDGSTDDSLAIVQRWARESAFDVAVLEKSNGGQASARNLGLESAVGEWVSFVDPDDHLATDFFEHAAGFIDEHDLSDIGMIATRLLVHDESAGEIVDRHPMSKKFHDGDRISSLVRSPDVLQLHLSSALLRRSAIEAAQLRFDERVRPVFEDVHFIGQFMLSNGYEKFGLVARAEYYYRVRADNSSTLQGAYRDPRKYTDVPRHGWLDLLQKANERLGLVPSWIQYTVIYDLAWIIKENQTIYSVSSAMDDHVLREFNTLLHEVGRYIDVDNVYRFKTFHLRPFQRRAIIACLGLASEGWESVHVSRFDREKNMVEVRYAFFGNRPDEEFYSGDTRVVPVHEKVQSFTYFNKHVFSHRVVWIRIDDGDVRVRLDGAITTPSLGWDTFPRGPLSVGEIEHYFNWRTEKRAEWHEKRKPVDVVSATTKSAGARRAVRSLLATEKSIVRSQIDVLRSGARGARRVPRWLRDRYVRDRTQANTPVPEHETAPARDWSRPVWVLVNRFDQAGDNAEHLYRYLLDEHPEIDAWFVLEETAAEWQKLKEAGFQLVDPTKPLFIEVMRRARHYISSQSRPRGHAPCRHEDPRTRELALHVPAARIMNSDISRWLNYKEFDIFVTSTRAEYEAVAGDGPYSFSSHEVRLTGSPRHDGLLRKVAALAGGHREVVMIMPTWRGELRALLTDEPDESQHAAIIHDTEYMRSWMALLRSDVVREMTEDPDVDVVFVPHPMLEQFVDSSLVPPGMVFKRYSEIDNQEYMARARLVVTDYSSITFDAALIKKPIVYYQFDREAVFSSGHTYRPGYFEYSRDGFGEVVETASDAEAAIRRIQSNGFQMADEYRNRVQRTFGERDDRSSERVYRHIAAIDLDFDAARSLLDGASL